MADGGGGGKESRVRGSGGVGEAVPVNGGGGRRKGVCTGKYHRPFGLSLDFLHHWRSANTPWWRRTGTSTLRPFPREGPPRPGPFRWGRESRETETKGERYEERDRVGRSCEMLLLL